MVAICNKTGAFIYNCTPENAEKRLQISMYKNQKQKEGIYSIPRAGDLDYDENGKRRIEEGMHGWIFHNPDMIHMLIQLNCEAILVMENDTRYLKYLPEQYEVLQEAFTHVYRERNQNT